MKSLFSLSCKTATYLVSLKEAGKISWMDALRLRYHLAICTFCKRFEQQTSFIIKHAKHEHGEERLSDNVKTKIIQELNTLEG